MEPGDLDLHTRQGSAMIQLCWERGRSPQMELGEAWGWWASWLCLGRASFVLLRLAVTPLPQYHLLPIPGLWGEL